MYFNKDFYLTNYICMSILNIVSYIDIICCVQEISFCSTFVVFLLASKLCCLYWNHLVTISCSVCYISPASKIESCYVTFKTFHTCYKMLRQLYKNVTNVTQHHSTLNVGLIELFLLKSSFIIGLLVVFIHVSYDCEL